MEARWRAVVLMGLVGAGLGAGCDGTSVGPYEGEAPDAHGAPPSPSGEPYAGPPVGHPRWPSAPSWESPSRLLGALPYDTPAYFRETYLTFMAAPLPFVIYDRGSIPPAVAELEEATDPFGRVGSFQPAGATPTAGNAFFQSLGRNGRACVTCHQPPSGMGVSVRNIRKRFAATAGRDPIFAPVDGANCPNLVGASSGAALGGLVGTGAGAFADAHSLLLQRGLIRIPIPVPPDAEFTLEVVSDPTTCNLDPVFATGASGGRVVSVFRRPGITASLNFKTTTRPSSTTSPITNIMWDGREPSLRTQAVSATMGHAQATTAPTAEQIDQIVAFEMGIFSAQSLDLQGGRLNDSGAKGGPLELATHRNDTPAFGRVFDEFDAWATASGPTSLERRSIVRGQQLFQGTGGAEGENRGRFTISGVAGLNDGAGLPASLTGGACSSCHNFAHAGSSIFSRSQRDIGIGGHAHAIGGPPVATDLPVFRLTCPAGSFLWDPTLTTVTTNDPGKALITGRCRDVGARTVPQLRGLASREPYFSDGSAATLGALVEVYDSRFHIGLTSEEKRDLVSFLGAL